MTSAHPAPETISDVVERLDAVIDWSRRNESRLGYFAVLYRNVTVRVEEGIKNGRFDDGDRMERFDVRFANRYLQAFHSYAAGRHPGHSWNVAFEAADRWDPLVVQHLLLGMNAHINLDLGIAAARTSPGRTLVGLEHDFREINVILLGMLDDMQECLSAVSPWCRLLDLAGGMFDELVASAGITGGRDWAWLSALRLAPLAPEEQAPIIDRIDRGVSEVGRILLNPGIWFACVKLIVRLRERQSVEEVMDTLAL